MLFKQKNKDTFQRADGALPSALSSVARIDFISSVLKEDELRFTIRQSRESRGITSVYLSLSKNGIL